jgi:hypothetical protein
MRPFALSGGIVAWWMCAALSLASLSVYAHPHDEPEIFQVKGTLTGIDALNYAIAIDTIDPTTRARRNILFLVDKKAKIRNAKTRVDLTALRPGQQVICMAERTFQEGRQDRERVIVFEIRADSVS